MRNLSLFIICCCIFSSGTLLSQDIWESESSTPFSPRNHPVTFSIDGYGYVGTGYNINDGVVYNDFYRFNPETGEWQQYTNVPFSHRGFAYGVSYEGKGYFGFGLGVINGEIGLLNDLWEFNPETGEFTELPNCPCSGRRHPALVAADGRIFVGAGDEDPSTNYKDFWAYDIEAEEWEQIEDLPGPARHHPYYFDIDDDVYVGFGHGANIYRDFYKYDTDTEEWVRLNDFPGEARVAGTQFSHNGKGYVLSGQGADHRNFDEGEFWEYDPDTDSWEQLESHPGPSSRWAPGSFVLNDNVYLISGEDNTGDLNTIYSFDLTTRVTSVKETETFSMHVKNSTMELNMEEPSKLKIRIFDVLGNTYFESGSKQYNTGFHSIDLNFGDNSNKVFFINVQDISKSQNHMIKYIK